MVRRCSYYGKFYLYCIVYDPVKLYFHIFAMLFMVNAILPSASLTIGILMKGLSTSEKIHRAVRTSSTGVEIPMEFENPMREAGSKDLEMLE